MSQKTQKETVKAHILKYFKGLVTQHGSADLVPMQNATKLKNLIIPQVKQELAERFSYSVGPKLLHTWSYEVSKKHFGGKILCAYQSVHYNVKRPVQIQPTTGGKSGDAEDEDLISICHSCESRSAEMEKLSEENQRLQKELEQTRYALGIALESSKMQVHSQHQMAMRNAMLQCTNFPTMQHTTPFATVASASHMNTTNSMRTTSPQQDMNKKRTYQEMTTSESLEDSGFPDQLQKKRKLSDGSNSVSTPETFAWGGAPNADILPPTILKVLPESAYVSSDLIVQICMAHVDCSKAYIALVERIALSGAYSVEEQLTQVSLQNDMGMVFLQLANVERGHLQIRMRAEDSHHFSAGVRIPIFDESQQQRSASDYGMDTMKQERSGTPVASSTAKTFVASSIASQMAFSLPPHTWTENGMDILEDSGATFEM